MIKVEHLTKRYGQQRAVQDISFEVNQGEVVGFLGPNGAGKTTTMNILTGYISSTSGSASINEYDVLENPNEVKKSVGYLPEQPPLYLNMTVSEYLNFVYSLKKVGSKLGKGKENKSDHIDKICDMVQIENIKDRLISNLSKGYKQRVGLAQAMLGDPEVLILDEPTVGLDPQQIIEIRNLIKKLGKTHTIILSSHILPEIQAICDRIIIINKGKIIADDTEENLANSLSSSIEYTVRIQARQQRAEKLLEELKGVKVITCNGSREKDTVDFTIIPEKDTDIRKDLFELMAGNNVPILELSSNKMTLEHVFLQLLAQDQEADDDYDDEIDDNEDTDSDAQEDQSESSDDEIDSEDSADDDSEDDDDDEAIEENEKASSNDKQDTDSEDDEIEDDESSQADMNSEDNQDGGDK